MKKAVFSLCLFLVCANAALYGSVGAQFGNNNDENVFYGKIDPNSGLISIASDFWKLPASLDQSTPGQGTFHPTSKLYAVNTYTNFVNGTGMIAIFSFPKGDVLGTVNGTFDNLIWNLNDPDILYGTDLKTLYSINWKTGQITSLLTNLFLFDNAGFVYAPNDMIYFSYEKRTRTSYNAYVCTYDVKQGQLTANISQQLPNNNTEGIFAKLTYLGPNELIGIYNAPIGDQNNFVGKLNPATGAFTPVPFSAPLESDYLPQGSFDPSGLTFYSYFADWIFFRNQIATVDLKSGNVSPYQDMKVPGHPDWLIAGVFDTWIIDD